MVKEEMSQITIKQHYVPRFYMKNFSTIVGSGEKEKAFIAFYQFEGDISRKEIQTKTLCYEEYFYGMDGKIEKDFSVKESLWAVTIRNIVHSSEYNLDEETLKSIKHFAVYQYSRTLATYKHGKAVMSEIMTTGLHNNAPSIKKEEIRKIVNNKLDNEICVADVIKDCDELVKLIDDLDVSIIKYNTENKLITSDMPVVRINPFCPRNTGMANVGIIIFFPISPETLVIIYDGKVYKDLRNFVISNDEQDVINLNKYQYLSAEERILSKHLDEIKLYIEDEELIAQKNKIFSLKKAESSFDGVGTFFAAKSRIILYSYKLSFGKLPAYLKKIPIDCRDAPNRQYSFEERIRLLVSVYKLPDQIKDNPYLENVNIQRRKDGYSKMQKFMDDYWNLEIIDRTITPELMMKLKTVQMNFMPLNNN